ncbi:MAG: Ig-like domain-containing protein [Gammaproteobacteria bacterium]|nr:Ig-like domain-containing protein [Gammaproteobacteria bacterium]
MIRIITHGISLGDFPAGLKSFLKPALAMVLITLSSAANAAAVVFELHNQTAGSGTISTLITDGSHVQGFNASTATWDWDGTTLTATGRYSATGSIGSSAFSTAILNDDIMDLSIDTGAGLATATSYVCNEGTFLASVGASGCGGHNLGANFMSDSTTTWGPGLATSQTIGGDDVLTGTGARDISAYDFNSATFEGTALHPVGDGMTAGDRVIIGNGIMVGTGGAGGETMVFIVPGGPSWVLDDGPVLVASGATINIDVLANDDLADTTLQAVSTPVENVSSLTVTDSVNGITPVVSNTDAGLNPPRVDGFPSPEGDLSINYTAAVGFNGSDTFTYTVTDLYGPAQTATVTVSNIIPDAVADTQNVNGDTTTPVATNINVETNDTLGDDTNAVTITAWPSYGAIGTIAGCDVKATCVVPYTPDANYFGADAFTYQLADGNGETDTAIVTINVVDPNIPSATDDNITTDKTVAHDFNPLANDAGLADEPLTITLTQGSSPGGIASEKVICDSQAACQVTFTPDSSPDFVGDTSFTYVITDSTLQPSPSATVNVFVNDLPLAVDDLLLPADTGAATTLDVQDNDTGLNDTPVSVTVASGPSDGTAIPDGSTPQMITYTSNPTFVGTDTFTYTLLDNKGNPSPDPSNTATVTVIVDDQPVAVNDGTAMVPFATVLAGDTVSLNVLANDSGLNDIDLTVVSPDILMPSLGTLSVTGSPASAGAIRIDYTAGATAGADSFDYRITDQSGDFDTATVFIAVALPNIPVAVNDTGTTLAGQMVAVNVLTNDTGLDDTPLTVTITTDPSDGVIGSITNCDQQPLCQVPYTPNAGFVGTDTYQYMVTDSTPDNSNIATVTITVDDVPVMNDIPRAIFDTAATLAGEEVLIDVLANDTSLADTPLTVAITTDPSNGTAVAQSDNTIAYTPNAGFASIDSFQYQVTDSTPDVSNVATVSVTVTEVPVAVDDSAVTSGAMEVVIPVLDNDTGLGSIPLMVTIATNPGGGTAVAQSDNTIVYTSSEDGTTSDVFDYTVTDNNGKSSTARVTVNIDPDSGDSQFKESSSAIGPVGLGLLMLLPWLRRRRN